MLDQGDSIALNPFMTISAGAFDETGVKFSLTSFP